METDRLISIIMVLLNNERISAIKLAEMFEVTPRTIYRDIDSISLAGIPIITYTGTKGGIGIVPEYKIDKKFFTTTDISTLLMGLSSVSTILSDKEVIGTLEKIKSLLPKDQFRDIELKSNESYSGNREKDKRCIEIYKSKSLYGSDWVDKRIITIKLLVDWSLREQMVERCGEENVKAYGEEKFIVEFPFVEDDLGYNILMGFGDKCECLAPENVRIELIKRIKKLLLIYEK